MKQLQLPDSFTVKRGIRSCVLNLFIQNIHFLFVLVALLPGMNLRGQVKMPEMVKPGDSWGIIDVNNMFGGCMQMLSYNELIQMDVQFLKRGMLFVVYDYDGDNSNGLDTRVYMFLPEAAAWNYNTPFDIPAVDQNKTIQSAGLINSLLPVSLGLPTSAVIGEVSYKQDEKKWFSWNGSIWEEIAVGDDLGSHVATQAIKLGSFPISNDGDAGDGLSFDASGNALFERDVTVNGDLYIPSDERLKKHIETLSGVIENINQLRGVEFEYIDQKKYASGPKIGVIAQELQKIYPCMVSQGNDGFLKVDYTQLTGVLIQAVKEQQKLLLLLQNQILQLNKRMDWLEQSYLKSPCSQGK